MAQTNSGFRLRLKAFSLLFLEIIKRYKWAQEYVNELNDILSGKKGLRE